MNSSSGSADRLTVFGRKGCVQCDATCRALDEASAVAFLATPEGDIRP